MKTVYSIYLNNEYQESWETFQDAFDRCMSIELVMEEDDIVSIVPEHIPDMDE